MTHAGVVPWVLKVLVECPCGQIPLGEALHATSQQAWEYASKHQALNPTLCRPSMRKVQAL